MAALTQVRNVPRHSALGTPNAPAFPQKANVTLFTGALAVLNAGYLAPGTTATGLVAVGVRTKETVIGGGSDGAANSLGQAQTEVEAGVFPFKNSASGDLIAQADCGNDCFIVDDNTVAKTNGTNTRSRAGKIMAVDANWVWVLVGITV